MSSFGIYLNGGIESVIVTRAQRMRAARELAKSEVLIYGAIQRSPAIVPLFVGIYLLRKRRYRGIQRTVLLGWIVVLIVFNGLANYPLSLPRAMLGSYGVTIVLLLFQDRSRFKPWFVLSMAVVLTIAFPYTDYFRNEAGYSANDLRSPTESLQKKPDYDVLQMLSNTVAAVQENGPDYGYHIVGSFLFFVPRAIWQNKPIGTGQEVGGYIGYTMLNLSSPLWAEFYYAGNFIGVLIGFCLYGRFSYRLEQLGINGSSSGSVLLAYLAGFQIFLLRGDFLNAMAFSTPCVLVMACFIGKVKLLSTGHPKARLAAPAREVLNSQPAGLVLVRTSNKNFFEPARHSRAEL